MADDSKRYNVRPKAAEPLTIGSREQPGVSDRAGGAGRKLWRLVCGARASGPTGAATSGRYTSQHGHRAASVARPPAPSNSATVSSAHGRGAGPTRAPALAPGTRPETAPRPACTPPASAGCRSAPRRTPGPSPPLRAPRRRSASSACSPGSDAPEQRKRTWPAIAASTASLERWRCSPSVAVQALRFRGRGPSGPAHVTGPGVRRTCRASPA